MKIRNIISAAAACAVAATAFVMPASAADTHKAAITFQSSSYMFRNTLGQNSVLVWDDDLGEPTDVEGASFVDATITGDGTYTVELNGVEDGGWNMLKVDTDIDADVNPDALITITGVEVNGSAVDFDAEAAAMSLTAIASDDYSETSFNIANGVRAQLINVYDNLAAIPNESYTSIKVTFDITGLGGGAPAVDNTDTNTDAPAPSAPAANDSKGSPDTGVAGIAVVAGSAIAAAGVVLLSKKRK